MATREQNQRDEEHRAFEIIVIGQEGDPKDINVRPSEELSALLTAALRTLYTPHPPAAELYDVVLDGKFIEPLTQTVASIGIKAGTKVSILPKTVTRGGR